jgi:uncharacterized protein (TIGR03435 family)
MTHSYIRFLSGVIAVVSGFTLSVSGRDPLYAQAATPERLPSFEVASVKENKTDPGRTQALVQPGGRFVATNAPLKLLIADAFLGPQPLAPSRVVGGPEWIDSARYDINAKASTEFQPTPGGPPREMLLMLRSLLEERFKLVAHRETRELPVYELVLARTDGKLGPELRQSTIDCDALIAAVRAGGPPPPRQPNQPPPCGAMRGPARILSGGIPMQQFATMLTLALADASGPGGRDQGRLIIDKTGLTGKYEFTLAWTPEQMPTSAPPPGVPPIDPNGPSFFTALQDQLGLKIQSAKGPVEVVVIDSIERPTPD